MIEWSPEANFLSIEPLGVTLLAQEGFPTRRTTRAAFGPGDPGPAFIRLDRLIRLGLTLDAELNVVRSLLSSPKASAVSAGGSSVKLERIA